LEFELPPHEPLDEEFWHEQLHDDEEDDDPQELGTSAGGSGGVEVEIEEGTADVLEL
jgi:hypothetical protein